MKFYLVLLFLVALSEIDAHSYLSNPISRANQRQTQSGCRGPACLGPCEVTKVQALTLPASIARGDSIQVQWPRNNHAGGFVRYAWAPFDSSDDMSVFDNNAQVYTCFEIGTSDCGSSDPTNPNGGDDGNQFNCGFTLTVPGYLTDGKWTLQWAWFGGAFTLGDYYSCVDYNVAGGPSSAQQGPYFLGGDYSNPTNTGVCKWFNTDRLHVCVNEPCANPIKAGENVGPVYNVAVGTPQNLAGSSSDSNAPTPCTVNSDCPSGVCQVNNFCYKKSGGLDGGGIAALFFAFLFVIIVAIAVLFVFVNKTEWRNWRPFKR